MASLRAEIKRAFLQSIYDAVADDIALQEFPSTVPDSANIQITTLVDGLKAFQRTGLEALKGGRLSLGSSGIGHEVRWAPPDIRRSFSQEEVFSLSQELREVYEDALVRLSSIGNNAPNDITILRTMMTDDRLETVTSLQHDFVSLRWGQRY